MGAVRLIDGKVTGFPLGVGKGKRRDLRGVLTAQIHLIDAVKGIPLGDAAAQENITFGKIEQQLKALRRVVAPAEFGIPVLLCEQIAEEIVPVGIRVVHKFLPDGVVGVLDAARQHPAGDFLPLRIGVVRTVLVDLAEHGDVVVLIRHTGQGKGSRGLGAGIRHGDAAQQHGGDEKCQ